MEHQKNSHDPQHAGNRRKQPREKDRLFQFMVGLNVVGWLTFLAALLVFHYARPEFISGVQAFWGISGRQEWSQQLSYYLVALLCVCVALSTLVLLLKRQRNRRENDYYGINGYVLLFSALGSLLILYFELNPA